MKRKNIVRILIIIPLGIIFLCNILNLSFNNSKATYNLNYESLDKLSNGKSNGVLSDAQNITSTIKSFGMSINNNTQSLKSKDYNSNKGVQVVNFDNKSAVLFYTKTTSIGLTRYLPIYKPINFSSKIIVRWNVNGNNSDSIHLLSREETINIKGHINIVGICTASTAKQLINDLISTETKKIIDTDINTKLSFKK